MTVKAICNRCNQPFAWDRTYASRHAVRRTCRRCRQLNVRDLGVQGRPVAQYARFCRVKANGSRAKVPLSPDGESVEHLPDGSEIMAASPVRCGCPLCSQPYSLCDCQPAATPLKGEDREQHL